MNKVNVLYTRKSDEDSESQVQSIPDQRKEIAKLLQNMHGAKIDIEYSEEKSALTPYNRTEFTKMIEAISAGQVRFLFCWKLNRLARNMIEGGQIIHLLQNSYIEAIVTPSKTYLPTENAIVLAVEFGQSNQYSIDLGKDVKRGLQSKADKGHKPGTPNIGYMEDKLGNKGEKRLLNDPERFDKVKYLLHEGLTGKYTYMELLRKGQEINLAPRPRKKSRGVLSKSTIIGMVKNPVYAGKFWYNEELKNGEHEAMIKWDQYLQLQAIFGRKNKAKNFKHDNKFNGLFKCGECGYTVIPEPLKKKNIKSTGEVKFYKYWRCSHKSTKTVCTQRSIREEELLSQVNEYLSGLEMDREFIAWGMRHIETYSKGEVQLRQTLESEHKQKLNDATFSLDRLATTFFSPANINYELLTETEFKQQKVKLQELKDKSLEEVQNLSKRQDEFIEKIENDLQFCENLLAKFNHGTNQDKKYILQKLGRTMILKDGNVAIESNIPFIQFKTLKKEYLDNPAWVSLTEDTKNKDIQTFEKIQTIISE